MQISRINKSCPPHMPKKKKNLTFLSLQTALFLYLLSFPFSSLFSSLFSSYLPQPHLCHYWNARFGHICSSPLSHSLRMVLSIIATTFILTETKPTRTSFLVNRSLWFKASSFRKCALIRSVWWPVSPYRSNLV